MNEVREWGEAPATRVGAGSLYVPTDCMDQDAIARAVKATIDDDATTADAGLARAGANYQLWVSFMDHTGVSLRPICQPSIERCVGHADLTAQSVTTFIVR